MSRRTERDTERRQRRMERINLYRLTQEQKVLAGKAISEIKGTPGFQIILEMLETVITRAGSEGMAEINMLEPEEIPRRAGYYYGYETHAIHLMQQLDELVGLKEQYEQKAKRGTLDQRVFHQVFQDRDPVM